MRQKAFQYLDRAWCSIYLILDEQELDAGRVKIAAYFTLSHKTLIPTSASKSRVKETSGFGEVNSIHFVLIGQLGKYIEEFDDGRMVAAGISSGEILEFAFDIISEASSLIPCRCALVECNSEEKVHKVYTDYGFKKFQYDGEHYQFYKRI